MFLSESRLHVLKCRPFSSLKRAMIFKIASEFLLSVLICTMARSSFLTWLSQITNKFHSFSLVLQNTCLLALWPLNFSFLVQNWTLWAQTFGDLSENALFIYLQFCISCLPCLQKQIFFWVMQHLHELRHFQINMMKYYILLACSCFSFAPMQGRSAKEHSPSFPNMRDFPGIDF